MNRTVRSMLLVGLAIGVSGCAGHDPYYGRYQHRNALTGAAIGAVGGALVGRAVGGDAKGAIVGGAVGAAAGGAVGHSMDQRERGAYYDDRYYDDRRYDRRDRRDYDY